MKSYSETCLRLTPTVSTNFCVQDRQVILYYTFALQCRKDYLCFGLRFRREFSLYMILVYLRESLFRQV